jgi:hypothetical protein
MSAQTIYLGLVIAAFTLFAVVLMGTALWTNSGKPKP